MYQITAHTVSGGVCRCYRRKRKSARKLATHIFNNGLRMDFGDDSSEFYPPSQVHFVLVEPKPE